MSLDYEKIKKDEEGGGWWTSYSDLWAMLSVVFLLLYVVTSLRTGTQGVQQLMEQKRLQQKVEELEEQNKVYTTLKDQHLQQASQKEQEVYKKLMGQLNLLQTEAEQEKNELRRKAQQNEEKEYALNQYQQIVKNIIDTNVLAKAQIQTRDQVITQKRETIKEKQEQVKNLQQKVEEREKDIAQNEKEINEINDRLEQQIQSLREEERKAKVSKKAMRNAIERLKKRSQAEVALLQEKNEETRMQMKEELEKTKATYASQIDTIKAQNEAKLREEQEQFESKLKKQKLSAKAKRAKLEAFQKTLEAKAKQQEEELSGKLAELKDKIENTENQLQATNKELNKTVGNLKQTQKQAEEAKRSLASVAAGKAELEKKTEKLGAELADAKSKLAAKKNLVNQIKKNFKKAGISAQVDEKTGDVIIDFGDEYFDSGKASLKPGMVSKLKKFIPEYSKSLFENPETAKRISNVEIIGFASSTYQGKYVNPTSLKAENQEAINYNLKLSFDRANSIFRHIFDPSKMTYDNQKRLLPIVKVVGRGFLPEGSNGRDLPDNIPTKEFCEKFNCKKAQRVMIKFNLKD